MGAKTLTTRQVFRQRSTSMLAAGCGAIGLLLLLSLARNWADSPRPLTASWVLFGLACGWSIFVRPAVLLDSGGVTVRNVVRDIYVPWASLTDVESRWNLKVFVGDRGYTAWAISSQIERPKGSADAMLGSRSLGAFDRPGNAVGTRSRDGAKVTASSVARSIEQAKLEYDEAFTQGRLPTSTDGRVRITWVPLVMVVLLLPAIAVVVLTLT